MKILNLSLFLLAKQSYYSFSAKLKIETKSVNLGGTRKFESAPSMELQLHQSAIRKSSILNHPFSTGKNKRSLVNFITLSAS